MRKEKTEHSARLPFAASMLIFGTIGLLRRFIDLPSGVPEMLHPAAFKR